MKKKFVLSMFIMLLVFACAENLPVPENEESLNIETLDSFDDECFSCIELCPPGELCIPDPNPNPNPPSGIADRFQYFGLGLNSGNLNTSYSTTGAGSWSSNGPIQGSPVNGAGTSESPEAIMFQGVAYLFYTGRTNPKIYYARTFNGSYWQGNTHLNSAAESKSGPVATVLNDQIFVYHIGKHTSRIYVSESHPNSGSNYYPNQTIKNMNGTESYENIDPNYTITEQLEVVTYNGTIYLFYLGSGTSSKIFVRTSTDGVHFEAPQQVSSIDTNTGIDVTVHNNQMYIAHRSSLGGLRVGITSDPVNQMTVRNVRVAGSNVTAPFRPSIASNGSRIVVSYKSYNNGLTHYAYSDDNAVNWTGHQAASGQIGNFSTPSIIYTGN